MHLHLRLADAAGNCLAETIAKTNLAEIANRHIGLPPTALATPLAVVIHPQSQVIPQQGAVPHRNHLDSRQCFHALEGLQHTAGIGAHQAVVIETKIRSDSTRIEVIEIVAAIMQTEGVTGEEHSSAVIVGKDRVGPMQIGRTEKLKTVGRSAVAVGAQIKDITRLDSPAAEGSMHLVFEKLDRHLGGNDFHLGISINNISNQAGMVGLGVGNN